MTLKVVISGGQTGADMAGLRAAKASGLLTGGTAPKGWRTENGPRESLLRGFSLVEAPMEGYPFRTRMNVRDSDGTLLISRLPMGTGTRLTDRFVTELRKPSILLTSLELDAVYTGSICRWIIENKIKTLNVAGTRESNWPGLERLATEWLIKVFEAVKGAGEQS